MSAIRRSVTKRAFVLGILGEMAQTYSTLYRIFKAMSLRLMLRNEELICVGACSAAFPAQAKGHGGVQAAGAGICRLLQRACVLSGVELQR